MVPTLIYSGTRNATLQVMKAVNEAHDTAGEEYNPDSSLIRRYHASTGDMDKEDTISGYKRADFSQMIGRCGHDGKSGLAILFVESKRKFGLNTPEAIKKADKQANDTRMDALAITPVCIRIALSIDNLHGYIPMDRDDLNYLHEESREADERFPPCGCSNCDPVAAQYLKDWMMQISNGNFDAVLENPKEVPGPLPVKKPKEKHPRATKPKDRDLRPIELLTYNVLLSSFSRFFIENYGRPWSFFLDQIFGHTEADAIARNLDTVKNKNDIAKFVGPEYQQYLKEVEDYSKHIDNEMTRIQKLKRKFTPISAPSKSSVLPAQSRSVRKIASLPRADARTPGDGEGTSAVRKVRKPRASATQVAENNRIRAENKARKAQEDANKKLEAKKNREANKVVLEEFKKAHTDKRLKLRLFSDPPGSESPFELTSESIFVSSS
ncbi:hypothetical protein PTTG_26828 [Puccinia triticina 1-1 BBBD Race 1]|uniref:Helicase C-terminal domain-containing protein n=1 Tax=Puccinia triticina (isolate 1-1 / race 1 (BBBD)) TaxID=630390 RepID=A0A180GRQ3_PUCT1|nr:hypothetical protein PTTG_26828 [Puccinia triticina 1-1 BBBD Race 1]